MKFIFKFYLPALIILVVFTTVFASCSNESESAAMTSEDSNRRIAVASVHVAAVGLGEILKGIQEEDRRLETIRNFVDPVRFFSDQSGYFYVYYYNCISIANGGNSSLIGKDFSTYQDLKGKYVIRELSDIARNGGGFMDGYWPHPQTKLETRKIGYVEPIPGTGYFIGAGYYPDTR